MVPRPVAGGALMVNNGSSLVIQQSTFQLNNATNGGALYLEASAPLPLPPACCPRHARMSAACEGGK